MNELTIAYQVRNQIGLNPWLVQFGEQILITSNTAADYMYYKYGSFVCTGMLDRYAAYNTVHAQDLAKALTAWNAEYNPLENVSNNKLKINTANDGDVTKTHTTGGTDGTHNYTESAALIGSETSTYTTTFDNDKPRLSDKTTNSGGTKITDNLHTADTTTHTSVQQTIDNETYTADSIKMEKITEASNNGKHTVQELIMSETQMRLNPVITQYLDRFVYENAYYIGGALY